MIGVGIPLVRCNGVVYGQHYRFLHGVGGFLLAMGSEHESMRS